MLTKDTFLWAVLNDAIPQAMCWVFSQHLEPDLQVSATGILFCKESTGALQCQINHCMKEKCVIHQQLKVSVNGPASNSRMAH